MTETAVFEFFVRKLPPSRSFLMAAGLEQVARFPGEAALHGRGARLARRSGRFSDAARLPGGLPLHRATSTPCRRHGLLCRRADPAGDRAAAEAQLLETRIINLLHFQTVIASKAARMVLAAPDKTLVDFGLRRAHGAEAGPAGRAGELSGRLSPAPRRRRRRPASACRSTAPWRIPSSRPTTTSEAFETSPGRAPTPWCCCSTPTTPSGGAQRGRAGPELARGASTVRGVRLDSGDLAARRRAAASLDAGGLAGPDLRQRRPRRDPAGALRPPRRADRRLRHRHQPDHASRRAGARLRLQAAGLRRAAEAQASPTARRPGPGRKQVYRRYGPDAVMAGDVLTCEGDSQGGEALVAPVMRAGRRIAPLSGLEAVRAHAASELRRLPAAQRSLDPAPAYPVEVSAALRHLAEEADRARQEAGGA